LQALELSPNDKTALVSRSKCYLLLGQPRLALKDAEVALNEDGTYLKGNKMNDLPVITLLLYHFVQVPLIQSLFE